jgi:Ulp1 family protease
MLNYLQAFVPVFDKERSHFFLFVLQLKKQVVEIWDSIAASSQSDWADRRLHELVNGCIPCNPS